MKSVEKSSLTTMMILSSLPIRRFEFRNSKQETISHFAESVLIRYIGLFTTPATGRKNESKLFA